MEYDTILYRQKRRRRLAIGVLTALAACTAGCGAKNIAPVSGRVTLDGNPVSDLAVTFMPVAEGTETPGGPSGATTDENGCFTLRMGGTHNRDGAVVGKHKVRLFTPPSPDGNMKTLLPQVLERKEHDFTVPPGGTQEANFSFSLN